MHAIWCPGEPPGSPEPPPLVRFADRALRARTHLGENPEARLPERELVELRVEAPEVVLAALVARLDLDAAHRQRPPARPHRPELASLLRLEHEHEVDLDVEHLLEAPDERPPHFLERVEERTSARDAR